MRKGIFKDSGFPLYCGAGIYFLFWLSAAICSVCVPGCNSSSQTSGTALTQEQVNNVISVVQNMQTTAQTAYAVALTTCQDVNDCPAAEAIEDCIEAGDQVIAVLSSLNVNDPNTSTIDTIIASCGTAASIATTTGHPDIALYFNAAQIILTAMKEGRAVDYDALDAEMLKVIKGTRITRAVTIGLNSVDPAAYGGWSGKLVDCEFDATFAAEMWQEYNIPTTTLLTKEATIENCHQALKEALNGLSAGDRLYVWLSGHGGQTDDLNGDESDGLDEYVCLYDGGLTDDTINEWLNNVTTDIRILWICDTCHSGTMNKKPVVFRKRAIPNTFGGQLILFSGCEEGGTSLSTGQGGELSVALHDSGPAGQSPKSWYEAMVKLVDPADQKPQYVEYGTVTDDFRYGLIVQP